MKIQPETSERDDAAAPAAAAGRTSEPRVVFDYESYHASIAAIRAKQIFFIGGAMKSGTTWLQTLLDAHPDVSCNGEGHFPNHFAGLLKHVLDRHNEYIVGKNKLVFVELEGYPRFTDQHFLYLFASAATLLIAEQLKNREVHAIGEKTPDNVRYFPLLQQVFPDARFIHIVRDGRDCAISGWFHNLRCTPDWTRTHYPSMEAYTSRFAENWAAEIDAGNRFATGQPERCMTVRYEDLSAAPEATLAKVMAFLDVNATAAFVKKCLGEGSFEKLSGGRRRGDENRASFFRNGLVGDWRNHFTADMNERFLEKAGATLVRLGYA
jgi:hypothetical protein